MTLDVMQTRREMIDRGQAEKRKTYGFATMESLVLQLDQFGKSNGLTRSAAVEVCIAVTTDLWRRDQEEKSVI